MKNNFKILLMFALLLLFMSGLLNSYSSLTDIVVFIERRTTMLTLYALTAAIPSPTRGNNYDIETNLLEINNTNSEWNLYVTRLELDPKIEKIYLPMAYLRDGYESVFEE